jgi:transcription-repair coupling factor (superfamily II helicase)
VLHLIQTKPHYKLSGQDKLRIELKYGEVAQRVLAIKKFFNELKQ